MTTTSGLDAAGDDPPWIALLARDPDATAFQGPVWLAAWADLRAAAPVTVRRFLEHDQLHAVVVEVEAADGARTVAGGHDVTDYRGPVAAVADRPEVAAAWLDSLADEGVDELRLHGIASDTSWLDLLAAADDRWRMTSRELEDVCPCVDLSGPDPASWLERIDGKQRHELRRKGRKLARDLGSVAVQQVATPGLANAVDAFWALALTSEGDKADFFRDPAMRAFFDRVVRDLTRDGSLRIHELRAGGIVAASMISVVHSDRWGLYNSAFDADLASYAPGMLLAAELGTAAAAEGFATLDFLRGDEAYKYRFGAIDRPIERAVLRRN